MGRKKTGKKNRKSNQKPATSIINKLGEQVILSALAPTMCQHSLVTAANMSQTCKSMHRLFNRDMIQSAKRKLLDYVMRGDSKGVRQFLERFAKSNPKLIEDIILAPISGDELHNGRKWKSISAFAFSVWSGDIFIAKRLADYVTKDANINLALKQLNHTLTETTEHGEFMQPMFELKIAHLIANKEIQTMPSSEQDLYYTNYIGNCQRNLPMIGLQQLCDQQDIYRYDLDKEPSRTCKLHKDQLLDPRKLGEVYILKSILSQGMEMIYVTGLEDDINASIWEMLLEARRADFNLLKNALTEKAENNTQKTLNIN